MNLDLSETAALLTQAATFIHASVRTVQAADGEPDTASECDHMTHDLACALSHEAQRLRVAHPAMARALASIMKIEGLESLETGEADAVSVDMAALTVPTPRSRSIRRLLELIDDYVELVINSARPGRDADADRTAATRIWDDLRAEARHLAAAP